MLKKIFFLLTLTVLIFNTSCSSDDDEKTLPTNQIDLKNVVNSKWIVSENSGIKSIELTENGNYIIIGSIIDNITRSTDDEVNSGSYTIIDEVNNIIELKEAKMRMKIVSYEDNTIEFILTILDTSKEYTFKATKAQEMPSTTNTELLCRTWVVVDFETTDPTEDPAETIGITVLFSKAGTYYVANSKDPESGGIAQWEWVVDSNESKINYLWDDQDTKKDVTIETLNEDSFIMIESFEEDNIVEKYTLKSYNPTDNTKSLGIKNTNPRKISGNRSSIFGRK